MMIEWISPQVKQIGPKVPRRSQIQLVQDVQVTQVSVPFLIPSYSIAVRIQVFRNFILMRLDGWL